jgi:hypothetical protein
MAVPDPQAEIKARAERLRAAERSFLDLHRFAGGTVGPGPSHNDDLLWLVGEVERLRGLLARLEWAGGEVVGDCQRFDACPECSAREGYDQHRPGCWLAAELEGRGPPDSPPPAEGAL